MLTYFGLPPYGHTGKRDCTTYWLNPSVNLLESLRTYTHAQIHSRMKLLTARYEQVANDKLVRLQVAKVFAKTNCGPFPRPEYLGVPRNRTGR